MRAYGCHTYGFVWSPDGTRLASTGHEGHVNIWEPSGKRLQRWNPVSGNTIPRLSWSFDGARLANGTGPTLDRVECHDPGTETILWETLGHSTGAAATALSSDGTTLAVAHAGQGSV